MANPFDQFDAPNPFDQFDPAVNQGAQSAANPFQGPLKQAGAGLTEFLAGLPGAAPRTYKALGSVISGAAGLPEPQPIINAPPPPESALISALPAPQNATEEAARNLAPFAMSAFQPGHVGENLAGAVGAAGGSYLGSQFGPSLGMTPEEGSLTGAIGGGFAGARSAGNKLNDIRRNQIPTADEVIDHTSASYDALRRANREIILPPDVMRLTKQSALDLLRQQGPAEEDAKKVYSIINGLDDENGGTVADLINARKNLHSVSGDANVPAAIIARQLIDLTLDKVAKPGTMAELQKNDANWAGARTAQALDTKIGQAESRAEGANSGLNTGNNIIQNLNAYIKSRTNPVTGKILMSPEDLKDINAARQLSSGQEIARYFSNMSHGGGGWGPLAASAILGLGAERANEAGYNVTDKADPLLASVGIPALGLFGRTAFNRSVARAAKNAEASILSRTPYAQTLGTVPPQPLLSFPQVAGRSLLFAAPALKNSLFSQGAQ